MVLWAVLEEFGEFVSDMTNYDEEFDLTFIDKLAEQDVTLDYLKVMIKLKNQAH